MKLKTILALTLALLLTACEIKALSFEEYNAKVDTCKNKMQGQPFISYYVGKSNNDVPYDVHCIVNGNRFEITK